LIPRQAQPSGFPALLAYVSNNPEATAQPNGYAQAEVIVTPLPAVFDPKIMDIMESRKNRDILSTHTQHSIAESQDNPEGVSSNEMLRMYSTMRQPPNPAKMNWANGERSLDLESYSPVPRRNINPKTIAPVADAGKDWFNGSNFSNRKALGLPEITDAAAEYYAVSPSNINAQTRAPLTSASASTFPIDPSQVPPVYNLSNLSPITSVSKSNKGKMRKVARALTAFGNRLTTRAPDQFDDPSSRSLKLAVDHPPICSIVFAKF
jgi:hypothetical protein